MKQRQKQAKFTPKKLLVPAIFRKRRNPIKNEQLSADGKEKFESLLDDAAMPRGSSK